ncbi:S-layer homology domain-containing protein [Paenibacillus ferrarius]|uniref:S-layer homology domain-containing protein n=1 Tax=Paenibacillus ferrarius TaxID=1469647 RepID=UPI003D2DB2E0
MKMAYLQVANRVAQCAVALLFMAFLMIGLQPAVHANQALPLQADVHSASGHAGETVSVAVYMQPGETASDDNFWKYTMKVNYDPSVLTLVGPVLNDAEALIFDTAESVTGSVYVKAEYFPNIFISERQKVFTMNFKIDPTAAAGDTPISIEGGSFTLNEEPAEITEKVSGKVTVLSSASPGTATVSIGTGYGQHGYLVTVPVVLSWASSGVGSFGIRLTFDPAALEVVSITGPQATVFDSTYNNRDGYLTTAWIDGSGGDQPLVSGQTLFTVTYKIKTTAAYGVKLLTVADKADPQQFTLTDVEAVELTKTLLAGSVTVVEPESSGGPTKEIIQVEVRAQGSKDAGSVSKAEIERTLKPDGTKSDKIQLTAVQAKQTVDAIQKAKLNTANIIIPDAKDEVSEVNITVPKEAAGLFVNAGINVGIVTDNARIAIPTASLKGFEDDLYFHFVPIKTAVAKQEINGRADKEKIVLEVAGEKGVTVVGRPMTIETNLQNRKVDLVMPLKDVQLSREQLANLAIYVEHSDGTKELLHGQLVPYGTSEGDLGLQFSINKFSTFALVQLNAVSEVHQAYIQGYDDHTFRPEQAITRAEMAAILTRVIDKEAAGIQASYSDVAATHWAAAFIDKASAMKLMSGYPDGTFAPDQPITRAEMASLAASLTAGDTQGAGFTDLAGHWAKSAILKVQGAGILEGYADGSFKPEQSITRAEAVTMMNRLLGRQPSGSAATSPWADVAITYWAFADIMEASTDR